MLLSFYCTADVCNIFHSTHCTAHCRSLHIPEKSEVPNRAANPSCESTHNNQHSGYWFVMQLIVLHLIYTDWDIYFTQRILIKTSTVRVLEMIASFRISNSCVSKFLNYYTSLSWESVCSWYSFHFPSIFIFIYKGQGESKLLLFFNTSSTHNTQTDDNNTNENENSYVCTPVWVVRRTCRDEMDRKVKGIYLRYQSGLTSFDNIVLHNPSPSLILI